MSIETNAALPYYRWCTETSSAVFPAADHVLDRTSPVVRCNRAVMELYGYCDPVIDVEASVAKFTVAYTKYMKRNGKYPVVPLRVLDHARRFYMDYPHSL